MNLEIPNYPALKKKEDIVAPSREKPDAGAKPYKSLKPRKRKRNHDARDVHFY